MNKKSAEMILNIEIGFGKASGDFWFKDVTKDYSFDYMTYGGSDIGCSHISMLEEDTFSTLESAIKKEIELLEATLEEVEEHYKLLDKGVQNDMFYDREEYEMNKKMFEIPLNIFKNAIEGVL